jgi:hypothetical protein
MDVKAMRVIPIYWGEWWVPAKQSAYNWAEVNGLMNAVAGGHYMDGLNQYGIGRGSVDRTYVHQIDPPNQGFTDSNTGWLFKMAIDDGLVPEPDYFDLATELPFYCLIVKPGIEHFNSAGQPESNLQGYHFGFDYDYGGDKGGTWSGQACWVKGQSDAATTAYWWVHEMAEAYPPPGSGEIADKCQGGNPVIVDGVRVPQYWSQADNGCVPPSDEMLQVGRRAGEETTTGPRVASEEMTSVTRARRTR